jgi:hypothetical protein
MRRRRLIMQFIKDDALISTSKGLAEWGKYLKGNKK